MCDADRGSELARMMTVILSTSLPIAWAALARLSQLAAEIGDFWDFGLTNASIFKG